MFKISLLKSVLLFFCCCYLLLLFVVVICCCYLLLLFVVVVIVSQSCECLENWRTRQEDMRREGNVSDGLHCSKTAQIAHMQSLFAGGQGGSFASLPPTPVLG